MKKMFFCTTLSISINGFCNADITPKAVEANTISYSSKYNSADVDFVYLQVDSTFALGENFGATLGANNLYVKSSSDSDNAQNLRIGSFYRNPEFGRVEIAYQQFFNDVETEGYYSATGEYYFDNWTLGAFVLSDDLSELDDINLYSNIYITDDIRLELDLLDATDNSVISATVTFQLPGLINNEWQFGLSYGEGFWEDDSQFGISVKYTPNFTNSLKRFYRNYNTNIKSVFFL